VKGVANFKEESQGSREVAASLPEADYGMITHYVRGMEDWQASSVHKAVGVGLLRNIDRKEERGRERG
jgi:hypothetical protein